MEDLFLAEVAFATLRTPGQITKYILSNGRAAIAELSARLDKSVREDMLRRAEELHLHGRRVRIFGDNAFPDSLVRRGKPVAPILFYQGQESLFSSPGVAMCGSRAASELGLKAARSCGVEVSERNLSVVSGYAKGVDTETHLAALESGGSTVIVLAEGFDHFRVKQLFRQVFDPERVLVLSQFPSGQTWSGYAAMARNEVIVGLGEALVVVEAGERGGTLAAGQSALKVNKPVLVLNFGDATPAGNQRLIDAGANSIMSRSELGSALDRIGAGPPQNAPVTYLFE